MTNKKEIEEFQHLIYWHGWGKKELLKMISSPFSSYEQVKEKCRDSREKKRVD